MTLSWPNHLLTLDEWEALPEDSELRLEIVEGVLAMSPRPRPRHQRASHQLTELANAQLPPTLIAQSEVEIVLDGELLTIRVPDVIVTSTALFDTDPARYAAADVPLAVEVLSAGTHKVDRIHKFHEYAESGIPQYWIVDLEAPASLLAYVLVDGHYELSGEHTGRAALDVAGHPVTLDMNALTRR